MDMIALTLGIGHNMWYDKTAQYNMGEYYNFERDFVYFERKAWDRVVSEIAALGVNTVIVDLAEGVRYDCAPELALPGTLSKDELKGMLDDLRARGLTPIPKLDFSAAHDVWLGEYSRMPDTDEYRALVDKMIREVAILFDHPAFFHLGLGDENIDYQRWYGQVIVRGVKGFWRDANVMFDACRACGARPIMSGEYFFREPQVFAKMIPSDVVVAAPYAGRILPAEDEYGRDKRTPAQKDFEALCGLGNELLLVGSGLPLRQNITELFRYAFDHPELKVLGVCSVSELPTIDAFDYALLNEAVRLGKGKEYFDRGDF